MKEQQCLDCGLFNLLSRHTCEYCGSTNLKVVETSAVPVVTITREQVLDKYPMADEYAVLGPAFLQCGKITGEIKDGVTLCGKPMYHEGEC